MTMTDPLADMLARIRNAQLRRRSTVRTPASRLRGWVLDVLASEGYIRAYERLEAPGSHPEFEISLKYFDVEPVIREIKRISKPGRRVYTGVEKMPRVRNGLGVSIVSTSQGVMSDASAREKNIGGEVLCTVF